MDNSLKRNPFSISKATDLTAQEINNLWSDRSMSFEKFIEPKSFKPKIILGSKGSGKTHLMRYFSYETQKARKSIKDIINDEKYIGIYLRASTLHSKRFDYEDSDKWITIFHYYFELYVTRKYLLPIISDLHNHFSTDEVELAPKIFDLFDYSECNPETLLEVKNIVISEIKNLNTKINSYPFNNDSINDIVPLFTKTQMIFGLPKLINNFFNINVTFNYFIDEYENYLPKHQKYIQTLVRERENPSTFRIGIRSYAFNDAILKTENPLEQNKTGSEIEKIILDDWLKKKSNSYHDFIMDIVRKKYNPRGIESIKGYGEFLNELFIKEDHGKNLKTDKAFKKLKGSILKLFKLDLNAVNKIIRNLTIDKSIPNKSIIEKINILYFYKEVRKVANKEKIIDISNVIQRECEHFLKKASAKEHNNIENKQKDNLLGQLYKENKKCNPIYLGFENTIKISSYNPRVLLNYMKEIYYYIDYCENDIEQGISVDAQVFALDSVADWFSKEFDKTGEYGNDLEIYIDRLWRFFQSVRLSDIPKETSTISFYLAEDPGLTNNGKINALTGRAILSEGKIRKGKKASELQQYKTYKLSRIFSKKYDLSLINRTNLGLNRSDLDNIFSDNIEDFEKWLKGEQEKMSVKNLQPISKQKSLI